MNSFTHLLFNKSILYFLFLPEDVFCTRLPTLTLMPRFISRIESILSPDFIRKLIWNKWVMWFFVRSVTVYFQLSLYCLKWTWVVHSCCGYSSYFTGKKEVQWSLGRQWGDHWLLIFFHQWDWKTRISPKMTVCGFRHSVCDSLNEPDGLENTWGELSLLSPCTVTVCAHIWGGSVTCMLHWVSVTLCWSPLSSVQPLQRQHLTDLCFCRHTKETKNTQTQMDNYQLLPTFPDLPLTI